MPSGLLNALGSIPSWVIVNLDFECKCENTAGTVPRTNRTIKWTVNATATASATATRSERSAFRDEAVVYATARKSEGYTNTDSTDSIRELRVGRQRSILA